MRFRNTILLLVLVMPLSFLLAVDRESVRGVVQTTLGSFESFLWSDYLYLRIRDSTGEKRQFYCNIPKCAEWEMNEAKFKGKKVKIKWRETLFFFKELKQRKKIREVVDLILGK